MELPIWSISTSQVLSSSHHLAADPGARAEIGRLSRRLGKWSVPDARELGPPGTFAGHSETIGRSLFALAKSHMDET